MDYGCTVIVMAKTENAELAYLGLSLFFGIAEGINLPVNVADTPPGPRLYGFRCNNHLCPPLDSSVPWRPNESSAIRATNCCSGRDVVFRLHIHLSTHLDDIPNIRKGEIPVTISSGSDLHRRK